MLRYIAIRLLHAIPTLFIISVIAFFVIQLPPGDFLSTQIAYLESQGASVDSSQIEALRIRYGIGDPFWVQYWKWITAILFNGDFGLSFQYQRPVSGLIMDRSEERRVGKAWKCRGQGYDQNQKKKKIQRH